MHSSHWDPTCLDCVSGQSPRNVRQVIDVKTNQSAEQKSQSWEEIALNYQATEAAGGSSPSADAQWSLLCSRSLADCPSDIPIWHGPSADLLNTPEEQGLPFTS